ncbi:MAG TPA: DoxX family protein [Acidimicrobiales bacterium]|nr:DoxX family protein [Acidimicrobiales bacterium]
MITPSLLADASGDLDGQYLGVLLIRVVIGLTLAAHGYYKFFKGGKIAGTARWFDSIGMRPNGTVHALMAATTEIGAGLLFAVGLLTPFAAAGFVGLMFVAAWTVNRPNGFFSANHGYEFNLTLAVVAVGVAAIGPGRYSLDWQFDLAFPFQPKAAVAIAAGLGLVAGIGLVAACFRPPPPAPADPVAANDEPVITLDDEPPAVTDGEDPTLVLDDVTPPLDDDAVLALDDVPAAPEGATLALDDHDDHDDPGDDDAGLALDDERDA